MAVEWVVPVAVAVGKLLLRASGKADAADAIGDAQEGWARLRQLASRGREDAIGQVIAAQLEQRLAAVTDYGRAQDLRATAEDVAGLISRLANDNEAVRVAAAHPEQFLAYANQRGADHLRQWTSSDATPLFDQVLEAAAAEFVELAPSSRRFISAGLTEVLRLTETLPEIHENARRAADGIDQLRAVLTAQRVGAGEPEVNLPRPNLIAQLGGKTEAELVVQQRVFKVVQGFPSLAYHPGAIPPGRRRADPKPSAIVLETGEQDAGLLDKPTAEQDYLDDPAALDALERRIDAERWMAVECVHTLELETVRQAIEENFMANGILVVGLDGSAVAAWVAPGSAYPITLPSELEIDQDWPLERVVRDALEQAFGVGVCAGHRHP